MFVNSLWDVHFIKSYFKLLRPSFFHMLFSLLANNMVNLSSFFSKSLCDKLIYLQSTYDIILNIHVNSDYFFPAHFRLPNNFHFFLDKAKIKLIIFAAPAKELIGESIDGSELFWGHGYHTSKVIIVRHFISIFAWSHIQMSRLKKEKQLNVITKHPMVNLTCSRHPYVFSGLSGNKSTSWSITQSHGISSIAILKPTLNNVPLLNSTTFSYRHIH